MRTGFTLAEIILTCTFLGLVAGIAVPRANAALDSIRLEQAAHEVAGALTLARAAAIRRAGFAHVVIDEPNGSVRVETAGDTILERAVRANHRVTLRATRDTITFAPNGLGYGVANSTIVVSLRQRAETVTVSRLGRMRLSW